MGSVTAARVAAPTLLDVIPSFERHLRAENKSPRTIQSYTEAVRRLHDFCSANGMPLQIVNITSEHIEAFLADQLARLRPASARARFASLRQFFAWLSSRDEREIERRIVKADPGVGIPWNYEGGWLWKAECVCTAEYFREPITDDRCSARPVRPGDRTSFRAVRVRLGDAIPP